MKYKSTIFIIFLFFATFSFGQKNCRSLDSILVDIANANYFKNSKINTGLTSLTYAETIDSQYLRYEELKDCASIDDLKVLLKNENNVVVAYSWKAYLIHNPSEALKFLFDKTQLLGERDITEFLNYCQGEVSKTLEIFMIYELYDRLLSGEIKLSSKEIVDFLNLKEEWSRKRSISVKDF